MSSDSLSAWLLEAETPTIRYLTARHLLHQPENHPQVEAARSAIMADDPVPAILAKQIPTGQWEHDHSYYTPKYVSTHWSLTLLTELHVNPLDTRFRQGVDYMLEATAKELQEQLANRRHDLVCFWANLLRYALHAGYEDDPRVQDIVRFTADAVQDGACRCLYNTGYACGWGVARSLWGLAALPPERCDANVQSSIGQAVTFLLESFNLAHADYPVPEDGKIHPMWFRLNFPLFYQADILFVLRVLGELNLLDHPGAKPALDWLQARRQMNGHWRGSSPFRGRTWPELGGTDETTRWVSLQAAVILQQAGRLEDERGMQPAQ